eukprot:33254_1
MQTTHLNLLIIFHYGLLFHDIRSETVICPWTTGGGICTCSDPPSEGTCTLDCSEGGRMDQPGDTVQCVDGYPCTINCSGAGSCNEAYLRCGAATSCTIICGDANGACKYADISCGTAAFCDIECRMWQACGEGSISCGTSDTCSITCKNGDPCKGTGSIHCGTSDCSIVCDGDLDQSGTCTMSIDTSSASSFQCTGPDCTSTPDPFTRNPTSIPSVTLSNHPSRTPSASPTKNPSIFPSYSPSNRPSMTPASPTTNPSEFPSYSPSNDPSISPSENPTIMPSNHLSYSPSIHPSMSPSNSPSISHSYSEKEVIDTTAHNERITTDQRQQSHSTVAEYGDYVIVGVALGIVLILVAFCLLCIYGKNRQTMKNNESGCSVVHQPKVTQECKGNNDDQGVDAALENEMVLVDAILNTIVPAISPNVGMETNRGENSQREGSSSYSDGKETAKAEESFGSLMTKGETKNVLISDDEFVVQGDDEMNETIQ